MMGRELASGLCSCISPLRSNLQDAKAFVERRTVKTLSVDE